MEVEAKVTNADLACGVDDRCGFVDARCSRLLQRQLIPSCRATVRVVELDRVNDDDDLDRLDTETG